MISASLPGAVRTACLIMPDPAQSCSRAEPKSPQISGPALKRLQKEMRSFVMDPPDGLQLVREEEGGNLGVWQVLTCTCTWQGKR